MVRSISSIGLAEAREAWLEDARFRGLSAATLREYERVSAAVLAYVAAEAGADPALAELTARRVRRWLTERPVALKPGSVAAYVRPLRAFSRWCAREYRIDEPLAGLRPPRVDPPPIRVFSDDQLRALLDGAKLHLAYAMTLLAETGLRVSEAVAMRLDDLDGAWFVVRRGKGGKPRRVPVSPTLARATRRYLRDIRPALAAADVEQLLVANHGAAWTADSLRRALKRLGRRTGVDGVRVSPHTFRHLFARNVAHSGGSLIALRDVLGHRSLRMVEHYAPPDDAARLALVERRTPLAQLGFARAGRRSRVSGEESA